MLVEEETRVKRTRPSKNRKANKDCDAAFSPPKEVNSELVATWLVTAIRLDWNVAPSVFVVVKKDGNCDMARTFAANSDRVIEGTG